MTSGDGPGRFPAVYTADNPKQSGSVIPIVSSADPGAVGAGVIWVDIGHGGPPFGQYVRNQANTGWQLVSSNPGGSAPSGPAGGDLAGTYPNPTVPGLATIPVAANAVTGPAAFGDSAVLGAVTTEFAREDHNHGLPSQTRIVRGTVNGDGTIQRGTGFTVVRTGAGEYIVTITAAFAATPIVFATQRDFTGTNTGEITARADSTTSIAIFTGEMGVLLADKAFSFMAIEV